MTISLSSPISSVLSGHPSMTPPLHFPSPCLAAWPLELRASRPSVLLKKEPSPVSSRTWQANPLLAWLDDGYGHYIWDTTVGNLLGHLYLLAFNGRLTFSGETGQRPKPQEFKCFYFKGHSMTWLEAHGSGKKCELELFQFHFCSVGPSSIPRHWKWAT